MSDIVFLKGRPATDDMQLATDASDTQVTVPAGAVNVTITNHSDQPFWYSWTGAASSWIPVECFHSSITLMLPAAPIMYLRKLYDPQFYSLKLSADSDPPALTALYGVGSKGAYAHDRVSKLEISWQA